MRLYKTALTFLYTALLIAAVPKTAAAQDYTTGLVGHWKLDETSGTTATASVGPNGTMEGGLDAGNDTTSGKIGTALTFDGVDDIIRIVPGTLDDATQGSIAFWLYKPGTSSAGFPIGYGGDNLRTMWSLTNVANGAGTIAFTFWPGSIIQATCQGNYPVNQWAHIVFTSDDSTWRCYINGKEVPVSASFGGNTGDWLGDLPATNPRLTIGSGWYNGVINGPYTGSIDDVRLYDRPLSAEDVAALYAAWSGHIRYNADYRVPEYFDGQNWIAMGPQKPSPTGLVGHWKLDEESGTLADSSGYGNDGTAIGGPEYASSGKIGYAMGFDGVDDNVNIGDPASGELDFNATQSFTYSIWVRGTDVDSLAFSKGNSSTGYDIIMGASSTVGQHACRIGDGSTDIIGTQTNWASAGNWHLITCVVDRASQQLVTYGDGTALGSVDISAIGSLETAIDLRIGMRGVGNTPCNCALDDARVYNRALSAEEIEELYEQGNQQFQYRVPLINPNPNTNDYFGYSVATAGTITVVGAYGDNPGTGANTGQAYVFDTAAGALIATLVNPNPNMSDYFGYSVATDGTIAVVGAYGDNPGAGNFTGQAYVFNAATGALIATLVNPNPNAVDMFGSSIATDGAIAVVSAPGDNPGAGFATGQAYVFNAATGSLIATLVNPNPTANDYFGTSVATDGTIAVVGAYGDDSGSGSYSGRAYVYNATTGALITTLVNPNPDANDYFGHSVATSGGIAVVGARGDNPGAGANTGQAYVFDAATGTLIATLVNPNPTSGDEFGYSVATNGGVVMVGASSADPGGLNNAGQAYVFDTAGALIATLVNPNPNANDFFGTNVATDGTILVVGASGDNPGAGFATGQAYVFGPGLCEDPDRKAGTIVYNADENVMQYCDGEDWIAMGPVPGAGGGGCSNPAGDAGNILYASDYGIMQYCDGSEWISIGKKADPCDDLSVIPGTVCADGTVYAGLSPDGNVPMYTTPGDAGQVTWNNGTSNWIDTSVPNGSFITGEAFTQTLASLADAASPYQAATLCYDLVAHGHDDWYLPARDELVVLRDNRVAIGGFDTSGAWPSGYYWSSTEATDEFARTARFNTSVGFLSPFEKFNLFSVRCTRKD